MHVTEHCVRACREWLLNDHRAYQAYYQYDNSTLNSGYLTTLLTYQFL